MTDESLLTNNLRARPLLGWLDEATDSSLIRVGSSGDRALLQVRTARDQWVALHGRHDPLRDARHLVEAARAPARNAVVVLLGAAAGHVAEVLLEESRARHVLIIEPHALSARTMLARRDWRPALDAGRLTLLVGPGYAGASDAWAVLDGVDDADVCVIEDAVLAREHAPLMERARDVLARIRFDAAANRQAREDLGARYARQTLTNLPAVLKAPSMNTLADRGRDWPAVILAAGPSLWRNLEGSQGWRDRVVLIAADTAVRTALAHGLEPDYIVAVDPTPANARHLRGLGALARSWLVAEASVAPAALDVCDERRTFFRVADNIPWPWLERHGLDLPRLAVWGSVLTAAYSLARHLSCASISLLGADLAFTDGQPYTRGVAFERDWARQRLGGLPVRQAWERQRRKRHSVDVPDVAGGRVLSAPHLLAFRDWLAERSARDGIPVRNATGRGALIGAGIEQATTDDFSKWPVRPAPFDPAPPGAVGPSSDVGQAIRAALVHDTDTRAALVAALAPLSSTDEARAIVSNVAAESMADRGAPSIVRPDAHLLSAAYPWLDERVVQWSAARAGRTPQWFVPVATDADANRRLQYADLLTELLARGTLTEGATGVPPALPVMLPPEVRLLFELPWRPEAEAAVLALQALAAHEAAAWTALPARWRADTPTSVASSTGEAREASDRSYERAARVAVMAFRTQFELCRRGGQGDAHLRACAAVIDGCVPNDGQQSYEVRARLTSAQSHMFVAATIARPALHSALEGALLSTHMVSSQPLQLAWDGGRVHARLAIRPRPGSPPAALLPCAPRGWLQPTWLTDEGLPPCLAAQPARDTPGVVLTPRGARASFLVDGHTRSTMLREWPMALVAELRGARWHVALNQEHHGEVRARAADDPDDIVTAAITGIPYTAAWASDDCVLVTTSTGLWEWTPRRAARLVAAVPAAAIIDVSAESVRLDPIPVIDGHYQPRVLSEGWHVSRAHGTITRHVLDAAGQAWSRTTRGAVVATAHPEAHVIRFDSSDTTCWLAWHRPRGVAWIDDQLLVWGADGRVALVPDAWSHVTGALAGTSPGRVSVPTE